MKYGLPYRGSKTKLADDIIDILPIAENFYDLFAGGCAITHCALLSNKYKNIYANDLQDAPQLFIDAVGGKYKNENRWISREQFFAEKDNDPYIRWIWSFGNNGNDYIFGKDIENIKREAHFYLFDNGYDGTPQKRIELIKKFKNDKNIINRFELLQLEQLIRLQQLERLQQLQQLQQLDNLFVSKKDYRDVEIKDNSIIYCDIPYNQKENVKEEYYGLEFNSNEFYDWAREQNNPVYFSSVFAPSDFEIVFEKEHQCKMNNKNSHNKKNIIERVYWNGIKNNNYIKTTLF